MIGVKIVVTSDVDLSRSSNRWSKIAGGYWTNVQCKAKAVRFLVRSFDAGYSSTIATARHQPALPLVSLTGKQATLKPKGLDNLSRLASFSI